MAKKKGKSPKKAPKRKSSSRKPKGDAPLAIPDRRALEGIMRGMFGNLLGPPGDSPLERAQDLVYEAFDTPDDEERIALAHQALEISPDCADAYVLLAENTRNRKDALELYEKAVAAGERALGPDIFRDDAGHFWGLIETRPYMRAREGLAHILWTMGRRDEAIGHLQDMIRLNPNDNQGLRYILAGWLLAEGRDEELSAILERYDEDTAEWAYTKALFAFRSSGDTPEANKLLKAAKKANKHVTAYLTGRKALPAYPPASYSLGSQDEAILYAGNALSGWKSTPGAIAWLKASEPASKKRKAPKIKTFGPLPIVKKRLEGLPRSFDVWQADFRPFGPRLEEAGELVHPWLILIASRSHGVVLAQRLVTEPPTPDLLWDGLAIAIGDPMMAEPHRPTEIQVRPDPVWDGLKPHLEEIGVELTRVDELDHIDELIRHLEHEMAGEQPPGLLEMPGIEPDHVAGLYEAAAAFYRAAPWRKLGYEAAIRIACDRFESGPWYAVVMGQSGVTMGVALYDDLKVLKRLWSDDSSDEENARETVALTLTFDEAAGLVDADLDAIEEHGFEVAAPEAYPSIYRKERGMSMRPPLAWEVELMEGCLRALPEFVATHRSDDTSPYKARVPTASGMLDLVLSWVAD